jgi:hypothetical protein
MTEIIKHPADGDDSRLGAKAAGLVDLAALGLPTPRALILRPEFFDDYSAADQAVRERLRSALIEQAVAFLKASTRAWPAVSLRCAVKHGSAGRRELPDSLLNLGLPSSSALRGEDSDLRRVCAAHAEAFFGFFGLEPPGGFASLGFSQQLEAALPALFERLCGTTSHEMDRGLIIQEMVYGAADHRSLTGMCYTRHPHTGKTCAYGCFIPRRQGMALGGIGSPEERDLSELQIFNPAAYTQLKSCFRILEIHYRDIRALEFTVEGDRLYLLQNTTGRRTYKLQSNEL